MFQVNNENSEVLIFSFIQKNMWEETKSYHYNPKNAKYPQNISFKRKLLISELPVISGSWLGIAARPIWYANHHAKRPADH